MIILFEADLNLICLPLFAHKPLDFSEMNFSEINFSMKPRDARIKERERAIIIEISDYLKLDHLKYSKIQKV